MSNQVLTQPIAYEALYESKFRKTDCKVGVGVGVVLPFVIGFGLGCAGLWTRWHGSPLAIQQPASTMAWSFSPRRVTALRYPFLRTNPSVVAGALVHNAQNRPRQHQGTASSYIDPVIDDKEKKAEPTVLENADGAVASPTVPYKINIVAHMEGRIKPTGGVEGNVNYAYVERKIKSALENEADRINSVDVRLVVEGHKPKTYQMEATVNHKSGRVVVSKSSHAQGTFLEAVDHMSDTLKRNLRKEKEKMILKKRHAKKDLENTDLVDTEDEMDMFRA